MPGTMTARAGRTTTPSTVTSPPIDHLMDPVMDPLNQYVMDPLNQYVTPYIKPAKKLAKGTNKIIQGSRQVHHGRTHQGEESVYELDATTNRVEKSKRGVDHGEINGFQRKIGQMTMEKGARKIVDGALDLGKIPGSIASSPLLGLEWGDPLSGAMKVADGTFDVATRSVDLGRHEHGHKRARKVEHDLRKQGDVRALGYQAAKHHYGASRQKDTAKVGLGALKVASGGLDLGCNLDPTQITRGVASGVGTGLRHGKRVEKVWENKRQDRLAKKIREHRKLANKGDTDSMAYVMSHDPRMASAQMLMHAQDPNASEEQRQESIEQTAKVLRLGPQAQEEMKTGRLDEFDKLYAMRTGQKMHVGGKHDHYNKAQNAVYGPAVDVMQKGWDVTGGKLRDKGRDKKEEKYGQLDPDEITNEYINIRRFRGDKTLDELSSKVTRKRLKKRYELEQKAEAEKDPQKKAEILNKAGQLQPHTWSMQPSGNTAQEVQDLYEEAHKKKGFDKFQQQVGKKMGKSAGKKMTRHVRDDAAAMLDERRQKHQEEQAELARQQKKERRDNRKAFRELPRGF